MASFLHALVRMTASFFPSAPRMPWDPLVGDRGIISITDRAGIDLEPDGRGGYDIGSISQAVPDNPADDILLMITAERCIRVQG